MQTSLKPNIINTNKKQGNSLMVLKVAIGLENSQNINQIWKN